MKFEIDIDLPDDVAARYRPVAFRQVQDGDWYFNDFVAKVRVHQCSGRTPHRYIILQPIATWPEWPEWLTAPWVASDKGGDWFAYGTSPTMKTFGWDACKFLSLEDIARHTNLTLPIYDGPWEQSLIRNPHLKQEVE